MPITVIGCAICGKEISLNRPNASFPPDAERCSRCDRLVCMDCLDWEYMMETRTSDTICKDCALNFKL